MWIKNYKRWWENDDKPNPTRSHSSVIPHLLAPSSPSLKFRLQEPIPSFSIPLDPFLPLSHHFPPISHIASLKIFFFSAPLSSPPLLLSLEDEALELLLASLTSGLLILPTFPLMEVWLPQLYLMIHHKYRLNCCLKWWCKGA